jgi:hypothetical protein
MLGPQGELFAGDASVIWSRSWSAGAVDWVGVRGKAPASYQQQGDPCSGGDVEPASVVRDLLDDIATVRSSPRAWCFAADA